MAPSVVEMPTVLMIEILYCLPVKSLKRFKCVCREWHDLIADPYFVANHHLKQVALHNNDNNKVSIFLRQEVVSQDRSPTISTSCFPGFDVSFSLVGSGVEMLMTAREIERYKRMCGLTVYGHCNGLLCLWHHWGHFTLWNPATREFKALPFPWMHIRESLGRSFCNGFGFDSITNDYKVISFFYGTKVVDFWETERRHCEVLLYSLRRGQWKKIASPDILPFHEDIVNRYDELRPSRYGRKSASGINVYINGVYYWIAYSGYILAFHMVDEVFEKLPMPNFRVLCEIKHDLSIKLCISNGCLAAIVYSLIKANIHIDLLVKKEASWVKQASFGPFEVEIEKPLGLLNNGGLLLRGREGGRLFLYNSNNEELKDLELDHASEVIEYVESLVPIPVKGANGTSQLSWIGEVH